MVTFLSGGTGTPKLLAGLADPGDVTVIANTGDDIELGGHLICPDLDTVLYLGGDVIDRETWWGIDDDSTATHDRLLELADAVDLDTAPRFLPADRQTTGRDIAQWRRFSGVGEFMLIGDRDRAVHITRTGLIDEGYTLTDATHLLGEAFGLDLDLIPMSDDPVASFIHTPRGPLHFQAFWVAHRAEPSVEKVEFRGATDATPTQPVLDALGETVIIGPSNPVTSIGPMVAIDGIRRALGDTTVVAVSPFIEDRVFSGPAAKLMAAVGYDPSTTGVAEAYPFADAFVLDEADGTTLDRPTVRTDTRLNTPADANRVYSACQQAVEAV